MTENSKNKKLYGLLGRNINYSLSPAMHNAAFRHFNIPAEYAIFDKEPNELNDFFKNEVLTGKIAGLNVTVPYKLDVKKMLEEDFSKSSDGFEALAKMTGAVNTITINNGRVKGYNTDAPGFITSISVDAGYGSRQGNENVFVAGAGGGSHAVCFILAFQSRKPKNIYVYDPEKVKTDTLKTNFENARSKFSDIPDILRIISLDERENIVKDCNLIVNTTPLGTHEGDPMPIPSEWLKPGLTVYDLVYARETELVRAAKEKGLRASGGLGMLVGQAAQAFYLWENKPFIEVREIMKQAALKELAKRKA
ncbi:MAG: shikimate dehydrogenase [Candidatus Omnitrophica bacterium]|nr:shikimate dehydrogenase [Candidatus Omnitrophota bacterium]